MSDTIISSVVTSTVLLDSPTYNDNVTVTGTGTVSVTSGYGMSAGSYAVILNNGSISSGDNEGIYLYKGGLVTNFGTIYGVDGGVYQFGGQTTIVNSGSIIGGAGVNSSQPYFVNAGIDLYAGQVTNETNALISGSNFGVLAYTSTTTITNDGTIQATAAAGSGVTTLTGSGATVSITDGIGVAFLLGGTLINAGTVSGNTDAVYFTGGKADLVVEAGAVFEGGVIADAADSNLIELASGASAQVLDMGGSFSGFQTIQIDAGAQWTLEGNVAELASGQTISGFTLGDTIKLDGFTAASESYVDGVLTLTNAASLTETITFANEPERLTTANFNAVRDADGTEITLCFYPGTRIATPDGDVAVEDLRAGDAVLTANGEMPVRWIGRSEVATRFADKLRSLPVRIKAGALGGGLPLRDLLVSPDHALFLDDVLVHASALVDGVNILRDYDVPEVFSYYHVELASHELLLAEGSWAESFVDNVERMHFHNWDEREAPAEAIVEMAYPRAKSVRQLPAALRARLARRDAA
jgi:hypothetical protein